MGFKFIIAILILLFFLIIGIYFLIISLFITDAKNKFAVIKKEIKNIDIDVLTQKLNLIKNKKNKVDSQKITEFNENIFYSKKQYELKIEKEKNSLDNELKKWYFFNSFNFHNRLNEYRMVIFEQYLFYLDLLFSLNEYLLEQEINSRIINSIKNSFGAATTQFHNSAFLEIRESKYLLKSIKSIEATIQLLETKIQSLFLSDDVKNLIKKVAKKIRKLNLDLDFIEKSFYYWRTIFQNDLNELKQHIDDNYCAIKNNKEGFLNEFKNLNIKKNSILKESLQFEIPSVKKQIKKIKFQIKELKIDVLLNITAYNLIINFNNKITNIINQFWIDQRDLIEYMKYWELPNLTVRLSSIAKHSSILMKSQINCSQLINDFKATISQVTPYELLDDFSKLITFFDNNLQEMLKNQKSINDIIKLTNKVKELTAEINTTLLNAEYDLNTLPIKFKTNYAMQLDDYQDELEKLMNHFKKSVKFVDNDKINLVKEILTNANKLQHEIEQAAFIKFYNENLIIELNKFNNNSPVYISFISLIEKAYHEGEQIEVLRLSKKLVENLNIHE